MFRAIFSWYKNPKIPATYTVLNMLQSDLRKVGINKEDIVIIAVDSYLGSWRRNIDKNYKSNRKEFREKFDINWATMFDKFDKLLYKLDMYSPFHVIQIDFLESDDIIAYACKYFSDKEVIILSSDSDYEMLTAYKNVKIFSPISKRYKHVKDPYKVLFKKISKEVSDNLVSEIATEEDFNKRKLIVSLLDLPQEIELLVYERLDNLPQKDWDYDKFSGSLKQKLMDIYKQDKIVSFDYKPKKRKRVKGGKK